MARKAIASQLLADGEPAYAGIMCSPRMTPFVYGSLPADVAFDGFGRGDIQN